MRQTSVVLTTAALLTMTIGSTAAMASSLDAPSAPAAPTAPTAPSPPAGPDYSGDNPGAAAAADSMAAKADMDRQLADARRQLEEAARQVAEISAKMADPYMDDAIMLGDGPPHAVIGIQLDTNSGKDGARIQEVSPGGPAADAGLHVGDVIVAVNGADVKGDRPVRQVLHQMAKIEPESKVKLTVIREGKPHEFTVTTRPGPGHFAGVRIPGPPRLPPLPRPPGPMPEINGPGPEIRHFDGRDFDAGPVIIRGPLANLELVSLTPQLGSYFGTDKGVLVIRAPKEDGFKLQEGDVILAIDGRQPSSCSHATRILSSYQPGEKISIKVMRQHKAVSIETSLPEGPGPGARAEAAHGRMIRRESSSAT